MKYPLLALLLLAACRREPPDIVEVPPCLASPELCNGVDDDCDAAIDEDAVDAIAGYADADGDGFGGAALVACADVVGEGGDCDDADAAVNPATPETADGRDEDCDGTVDNGTAAGDDDGDGWSEADGDCDDEDVTLNPDAMETPDGRDEDCDEQVDEGTADVDEDGWSEAEGDCDDTLATTNPGVEELCGDPDLDCDGATNPAGTAVFVGTDGARTDMSGVLSGSTSALAEVSLDTEGTLLLCAGTWYAALTTSAGLELEGRDEPVLSGAGIGVPVTSTGATLSVYGVAFEDGYGASGGCLAHAGGSLDLDTVTFSGCTAIAAGGGAHVEADVVTVDNGVFEDNTVEGGEPGGGGMLVVGTTLVITNTTFADNSVGGGEDYTYGGGLYFPGSDLSITGSTFSGNEVQAPTESGYYAFGGGLYTFAATTIETSVFSDNRAGASGWGGGGGALAGGTFTIRESTFSSNAADGSQGFGGAIIGNELVFEDSTIEGNSARYLGGAVFSTTTLTFTRCDILDNGPTNTGGAVYNTGETILTNSTSTGNGSHGYYSTGSCSDTETDDRGGAPGSVSLARCATSMTF